MNQLLDLFDSVEFKYSLDHLDIDKFEANHVSLCIFNKTLIRYLISHKYYSSISAVFDFDEISFTDSINWFHNSLAKNNYLSKFFDIKLKNLSFMPQSINSDTMTQTCVSILNNHYKIHTESLVYNIKRYLILDKMNKFQSVVAIDLKIRPINYVILIAHDLKKVVINKSGNVFETIKDYYFDEIFENALNMNDSLKIIDDSWTYDIIYREVLALTNNYQETDSIMESYKDIDSMYDMLQMIKI